jgi:hypothetical protein
VEFVLCLPLVIVPLIGMADVGIFVVQRMQVDAASQAGAAAAWHVCDDPTEPVTESNCGGGGLEAAITAGVESTSLGTGATLASTPVAGYYCATAEGGLLSVSDTWAIDEAPVAKPSNCDAAMTGSTTAPAQYVQVTVNYTYTPLFGALMAAGVLPETITRTSWRRIS